MFLGRNKKNNVFPVNPSFTIQKLGLKGSKLHRYVFVMIVSLVEWPLIKAEFYNNLCLLVHYMSRMSCD